MNVMIETATGLRTPSGVMTSAMPARVQASTSTVSYPTPKRATTARRPFGWMLSFVKRCARRIERVEIRKLVGFQWIARLKIGKLDIRRLTQWFEVEVGIDWRSVGLTEIAGQSDAKRRAHRLLPVFFGFSAATQPSRNLSIASLSASCSTQTSPE